MPPEKDQKPNDWPEQKPLVMYRLDECDKAHEEHREKDAKQDARIDEIGRAQHNLTSQLGAITTKISMGIGIALFLAEKLWDKLVK